MRTRLLRHIPTEFSEGNWLTAAEALNFINLQTGGRSNEWLILIPNYLTKLIWDSPGQVEGKYTMHYLWDLGSGKGDAICLPNGKWLVMYQSSFSNHQKFYCVVV